MPVRVASLRDHIHRSLQHTPVNSESAYHSEDEEETMPILPRVLSTARSNSVLMRGSTRQLRLQWGSEACYNYESLDFQDVENELLQEKRREQLESTKEPLCKRAVSYVKIWVLLMSIGVLTGTAAFGIDKGIDQITKYKWKWVGDQMVTDAGKEETIPFAAPYFTFLGLNLVLSFIAAVFVVFVEPLAAGSGIPEVKCYLNGIRIYRVVRLRTLVAKGLGILFSVASGLPCGKEGPMIHSGAVIGGGLATGKSSKLHFDTGLFKEYRGDRDKRLFVTAGAAAGVAAAFGAPIGGVLFAVEEVGSFWNLEMSVMVFFCSAFSSLAINLWTKFQSPLDPASGQTSFGVVAGKYEVWELPLCVILGALGGLLGALFNSLNIRLTKARKRYVRGIGWRRLVEVLVINFLVSTVLFVLASRLYECVSAGDPQGGLGNATDDTGLRFYGCNETAREYNNMATLYFAQTEANIRHMFHFKYSINYDTLAMHLVPYFFLTVLTYGIAVPSGLFLPCLALGSTVGRIYGQAIEDVTGADLELGSYACFGAVAVLGGVVRMTVSLSVIVMEATGNSTLVIPLMLITCTAKVVGDLFNHGIYDEHIHFNKIPLLERQLEDEKLTVATAQEVMNEANVAILPLNPTVKELIDALKEWHNHNAFLVTQTGKMNEPLRGLILRRYLLIILRRKAWGDSKDALDFQDFVKNAHERMLLKPQKYAMTLSSRDMRQQVNLSRYMDGHPFTVGKTAPLPRVFTLFRELGLRHLVVVDESNRPEGVIARKNLCYLRHISELDEPHTPERYGLERHPSAERFPSHMEIRSVSRLDIGSTNASFAEPTTGPGHRGSI